jgi:hypothetical protein
MLRWHHLVHSGQLKTFDFSRSALRWWLLLALRLQPAMQHFKRGWQVTAPKQGRYCEPLVWW